MRTFQEWLKLKEDAAGKFVNDMSNQIDVQAAQSAGSSTPTPTTKVISTAAAAAAARNPVGAMAVTSQIHGEKKCKKKMKK